MRVKYLLAYRNGLRENLGQYGTGYVSIMLLSKVCQYLSCVRVLLHISVRRFVLNRSRNITFVYSISLLCLLQYLYLFNLVSICKSQIIHIFTCTTEWHVTLHDPACLLWKQEIIRAWNLVHRCYFIYILQPVLQAWHVARRVGGGGYYVVVHLLFL